MLGICGELNSVAAIAMGESTTKDRVDNSPL